MVERVVCPHMKEPFEECYVSSMNSSNIFGAVQYCAGNYKACPIYRQHTEPGNMEGKAPELPPDSSTEN